jgi:hypothetical protein
MEDKVFKVFGKNFALDVSTSHLEPRLRVALLKEHFVGHF